MWPARTRSQPTGVEILRRRDVTEAMAAEVLHRMHEVRKHPMGGDRVARIEDIQSSGRLSSKGISSSFHCR